MGAAVDPGEGWRRPKSVTLVVRNCMDSDEKTRYLFEVECANGEIIASPPIAAGDGKTEWEAPLLLHPGLEYTWRVRILASLESDMKRGVPVASSKFTVKGAGKSGKASSQ